MPDPDHGSYAEKEASWKKNSQVCEVMLLRYQVPSYLICILTFFLGVQWWMLMSSQVQQDIVKIIVIKFLGYNKWQRQNKMN